MRKEKAARPEEHAACKQSAFLASQRADPAICTGQSYPHARARPASIDGANELSA